VQLADVARFEPCDTQELVLASFSCPLCLAGADRATLVDDEDGGSVACACFPCDVRWEVGLTVEQRLRLELWPPRELALRRP
jgi:hypothetical protein